MARGINDIMKFQLPKDKIIIKIILMSKLLPHLKSSYDFLDISFSTILTFVEIEV